MLNKQQLKKIVIPVILIVGVVVVGIVLFVSRQPEMEKEPEMNQKESIFLRFDYEPGLVTVLQGTIEDIVGNVMIVKAGEDEKDTALAGKVFDVVLEEQTEVFLLNSPFYMVKKDTQTEIFLIEMPGQDKTEQQEKQVIGIEDVEIADYVIVLSIEDIKGKDSFIAKEIYKR